jgi:hypothetical protein
VSTDLVPVDSMTELDALDPHARELAVTSFLERAYVLLEHAVASTEPARNVSEVRAIIATAADAARRVKVSKEIVADADVMVRRSERALGVAVRQGQKRGEINSKLHHHGGPKNDYIRNGKTVHIDRDTDTNSISPRVYLNRGQEQHDIYSITDGVTDEAFEQALDAARREGNATRTNVVRKIKGDTRPPKPSSDRHELLRNRRHIDPNHVIDQTVTDVENAVPDSLIEEIDFTDLDSSNLEGWVSSLSVSIKSIHALRKRLEKELTTRGQE